MKYKDYKHLIICISIISLWIMILFFLGNIVSSKIDILNTEKNQQQEELVSYYDFMAKNKNIELMDRAEFLGYIMKGHK